MAKNKDINISPSKGISIIIKNDIVQPLPPKPKKKRRYKRINVLPNTQVPIMQQSAGDTSYIKAQPGRFSLWRDTTTSTPVLTLAQATSQGFIPQLPQITAPPQPPQITAPPPQQALPAPPITLNFGDFMKALQPQEFRGDNQVPQIEDITDTFYQALPEDKKEEYQNAKLEYIAKDIDETAAKAIEDVENNDFYKTQLDPATQTSTKEKTALLAIQQKLEQMKEGNLKGLGTKDVKTLKEPRYPQNKVYTKAYTEGLSKQEESINKRIKELDEIIATKSGQPQARAETERITRNNDLKKIEDLFNKLKQEKKELRNY